jgi:hypothetical protein
VEPRTPRPSEASAAKSLPAREPWGCFVREAKKQFPDGFSTPSIEDVRQRLRMNQQRCSHVVIILLIGCALKCAAQLPGYNSHPEFDPTIQGVSLIQLIANPQAFPVKENALIY